MNKISEDKIDLIQIFPPNFKSLNPNSDVFLIDNNKIIVQKHCIIGEFEHSIQ
jgi:hypothetical protein